MTTTPDTTYDTVPYDDRVFYRTHPDVLAAVATLHGLDPVPVERCRVLELGCAVGGNLIPMALGLPDATFVGIDLSPSQIATGREVVRRLGLSNVELVAKSITEVDASFGQFDYILCHGVYSWVPREVQDAILATCGERLTANGIAYVSYNTYPGWHLRGMVRELMQHHARRFEEPATRIREARSFLDLVAAVQQRRNPGGAFAAVLQEETRGLRDAPDDYLFHEHLEDYNAPLYFEEFVERAGAHGLAYMDDARPRDAMDGIADDLRDAVGALASSPLAREQYVDLLTNRTFRRTLLCRAKRRPEATRDPAQIERLSLTARVRPTSATPDVSPGVVERFQAFDSAAAISTDDAALKSILVRLASLWPRGMSFASMAEEFARAGDDAHREGLAEAVLRCYLAGLVELHTRVPVCAQVAGARPLASPLARLQAERQPRVTNLLHRAVVLDDADRLLLQHVDGTRDRSALADVLTAAVLDGRFRLENAGRTLDDPAAVRALFAEWIEPALGRFASAGLLLA